MPDSDPLPGNTLLLTNRSSNWQLAIPPIPSIDRAGSSSYRRAPDGQLRKNKWGFFEIDWLDWDKSPSPKNIEFGLAEGIPFEMRFIPSEQMRRQVPKEEWR